MVKPTIGFLVIFAVFGFIFQMGGTSNYEDFLKKVGTTTQIRGSSFTGTTTDTTEAVNLAQYKTVFYTVQAIDSATILISYRLSVDGQNWSAFTTKDSLSHGADGTGLKSIDFTSTALGAKYVQFRNTFSTNAFAAGTTSPRYSTFLSLKKY